MMYKRKGLGFVWRSLCLVLIALVQFAVAPGAHAVSVLEKHYSVRGEPIPIYRYGEGDGEYIFLFAGFHGNEPQGPFILEQLMQCLEQNPAYYAEKSIFVMPRVNPDALKRTRRTNANGVDLNRNFPTQNFIPGAHQGTAYYAGAAALSEPETQGVHALLAPFLHPEKRPKVKILSIHAPYAVNNYDGPAQALATHMAHFNGYPVSSDIGYPTPGSFGTYYGKEKGLRVITLETDNASPQLAWQKQEKAILALLQFPRHDLYPVLVAPEATLQPEKPELPRPTPVPGGVEAFLQEQAQKP